MYYPGVGVGVGVGVSKKFNVKVFYVMGKALSGELSCPCDRSLISTVIIKMLHILSVLAVQTEGWASISRVEAFSKLQVGIPVRCKALHNDPSDCKV